MKLDYSLNNSHAKNLLICLISVEVVFCCIYFLDFILGEPNWRIHELFNLDEEANITSWFSTIQLYMIGLIAIATAWSKNFKAPPSKIGLTIFGLGFIYLSMDEASVIHEKLTFEFHNNPLVPYFSGYHGIWIVVYGCVGIITLIILHRDIWAVLKHYRREAYIFIFGMFIYLAGSGGAETITFFYINKHNLLLYTFEVILEEFLEMLGASILLFSVLRFAIKKN